MNTGRSRYPKTYWKICNPNISKPFSSHHLNSQSIEVDSEKGIRKSCHSGEFVHAFANISTLWDIFEQSLAKSKNSPLFGTRKSKDEEYSWLTYNEVHDKIIAFGSGIWKKFDEHSSTNKFLGIYGRNSPQWLIALLACSAYSSTVVPLYATLGDEGLNYILTLTELTIIVCDSHVEVINAINFHSTIKTFIVVKNSVELEELREKYKDEIEICLFDDFLKFGSNNLIEKVPSTPETIYNICFTSGSTGTPKGVIIEQKQIISALISLTETFEDKFATLEYIHLSYLPLAHILEQFTVCNVVLNGGRIGFLTGTVDGLFDDCQKIKPTVFIAVPRIIERIYLKYKAVIGQSYIKRCMYNVLSKKKLSEQKHGKFYHQSALDSLLFDKIRKLFGGNLVGILTGGAPMTEELKTFARLVFDGLVMEGYGLTETTGSLAMTLIGENRNGINGAVAYGNEVRLADVPECDIVFKRDKRGEICVRGATCTKGYYKDPVKTADLIDSEGWLHTGDIGEWTEYGALKIVDRIKSMFKLCQGEYISPEKVEAVYRTNIIINQIMVDGLPNKNYAVAIIVPNLLELRKAIQEEKEMKSLCELDDEEVIKDKSIKQFILKKMNEDAIKYKLKGFEMVKSIHLTNKAFTIENGLLTPTMKFSRPKIRTLYGEVIEGLYTT